MNRTLTLGVALSFIMYGAAAAQSRDSMGAMPGMDSADAHAADAAEHEMSGTMMANPHMVMTPARPLQPGDSARALALLDEIRHSLARYQDVNAATADGYRRFLPGVKHQPVYHYTNRMNALQARAHFDPNKPTSLLYREDSPGHLVLVGAMYSDAADTPLDELDRRIPLSIAHWHRHVNWCLPPLGARARWTETKDGRPVFGPKSAIATREACDAVGGRFFPQLFGWMVHVNAFASNPGEIWGDHHHDEGPQKGM